MDALQIELAAMQRELADWVRPSLDTEVRKNYMKKLREGIQPQRISQYLDRCADASLVFSTSTQPFSDRSPPTLSHLFFRIICPFVTAVLEANNVPRSPLLRTRTSHDLATDIFHVLQTGTRPPALNLFNAPMEWPQRLHSLYVSAKDVDIPRPRWLTAIVTFLNTNSVNYIPATHAGRITIKQYTEVVDPGLPNPYLAYELNLAHQPLDDRRSRLLRVFGEQMPLARFPTVYTDGIEQNLEYFRKTNVLVYRTLKNTLCPLTITNQFHRLVATLGLILLARQSLPWARDRTRDKTYDVLNKTNPAKWFVAFAFKMFWLKDKPTDTEFDRVEQAMIRNHQLLHISL
jgi:hypothetical protein